MGVPGSQRQSGTGSGTGSGTHGRGGFRVPAPPPVPVPDLDAALLALPAKYRVPVVLCYLHGKTYEEAAAELNCPLGTLAGWLTRAKAMLRRRLIRRGVSLGVGGLAVYLGGLGSQATAATHTIRTITAAAVAYAGGEATPGRATAVADGVIHMTTAQTKLWLGGVAAAVALLGLGGFALGQSKPMPDEKPLVKQAEKTDEDKLQGVWVFADARRGKDAGVGIVWTSKVTITGDTMTADDVFIQGKPLKGKIKLDPTADPKRFDLELEEQDLKATGMPVKVTAGSYPGIYRWDGGRLQFRFAQVGAKRPTTFDDKDAKTYGGVLAKAPADFKQFPKDVTVKVLGAGGKPVGGAVVSNFMDGRTPYQVTGPDGEPIPTDKLTDEQRKKQDEINKLPAGAVRDESDKWTFYESATTAADGTATVKNAKLAGTGLLVVRDPVGKQMGVAPLSPADVLGGSVTVKLQPECKVSVTAVCDEMAKAGQTGKDWFNSYMETADGRRFSFAGNKSGKLEYLLPPGDYQLHVYGSEMIGTARVKVTVPKDQSEYAPPPVPVPPTALLQLLGKPAPELTDVTAWKGDAVKLADLKGKYVLLEFWGWWCGPCIASMPVLMEVHERYKDKGVVVVGIHVDADGEVDSVKALDAKLTDYKKGVWKGKDIPFPVALVSGKVQGDETNFSRGAMAAKYGVRGYPSTLLIDRDGKVVGKFPARDTKDAVAALERLLKDEKK